MVRIIDTTLREGEQATGVCFSLEAKKKILTGLAGLGVDEVEIGIAASGNSDLAQLCGFVRAALPQQKFSLWCRCCEEDVYFAAALKPSVLALSIPASDLHLTKKMGKNREWAVRALQQSIKIALEAGIPRVAVGLEDATRAEMNFVRQLGQAAHCAGAFRLRLADTVGIADPAKIMGMVDDIKGIGMELGVHCHNDFGMATANSIAGLGHGATWVDATILGLGERAGNSRLEEVLSYLVLQKKIGKYTLAGLRGLSDYVARQTAREISPSRPILGTKIFTCETGIHLQGLMVDPAIYEPYDPEFVGNRREMLIGSKSGRRSIAATLKRLGLPPLEDATLTLVTRRIRSLAGKRKRPLVDHEIVQLATMV